MKELVVISGKGGTGKTSIVASFAALAENCVLADCDVDAADLHLVLEPQIISRQDFSGGSRAEIVPENCTECGECMRVCRFDAVSRVPGSGRFHIDPIACEGCGVCSWFCTDKAIKFGPVVNGELYISSTRRGPMLHAKLGVAEENSGKLVSAVRREARRVAEEQKRELIIVDGSPGIGCPVIASLAGADFVLVVSEPTVSGLHDLGRVAELLKHFQIRGSVCINKWDLNPGQSSVIEKHAVASGLSVAGRVRYDRAFTEAQIMRQALVEYRSDSSAADIRAVWTLVSEELQNT